MTTTQTFGLDRIWQVAVRVRDVDRGVEFYRDRLGMQLLFQVPGMAFFQCGDVTLMLGVAEGPEFDHPSSVIYYAVDDIESAHGVLSARGVRFRDQPHLVHRAPDHDLWMTFFRDADDNTLALMSRKARA